MVPRCQPVPVIKIVPQLASHYACILGSGKPSPPDLLSQAYNSEFLPTPTTFELRMASDSAQTEEGSHVVGQSQDAPTPPSQAAANIAPLQGTHLEVNVTAQTEEGSHAVGQSQDAPTPPSQAAANIAPLQGTHLEVDVTATTPLSSEVY